MSEFVACSLLMVCILNSLSIIRLAGRVREIIQTIERMESDIKIRDREILKLHQGAISLAKAIKTVREDAVKEATGVFADPNRLDAELERSAQLTENRRAGRKHAPRADAGPPAKSLKMRFTRHDGTP